MYVQCATHSSVFYLLSVLYVYSAVCVSMVGCWPWAIRSSLCSSSVYSIQHQSWHRDVLPVPYYVILRLGWPVDFLSRNQHALEDVYVGGFSEFFRLLDALSFIVCCGAATRISYPSTTIAVFILPTTRFWGFILPTTRFWWFIRALCFYGSVYYMHDTLTTLISQSWYAFCICTVQSSLRTHTRCWVRQYGFYLSVTVCVGDSPC